jgi:hypothetical protein
MVFLSLKLNRNSFRFGTFQFCVVSQKRIVVRIHRLSGPLRLRHVQEFHDGESERTLADIEIKSHQLLTNVKLGARESSEVHLEMLIASAAIDDAVYCAVYLPHIDLAGNSANGSNALEEVLFLLEHSNHGSLNNFL